MRECAGEFADAFDVSSLQVSVDGREIEDLDQYRAQSPAFQFTLPANNILVATEGTYTGVADGYWILLRPLSRGVHMVQFTGACSSGSPCDGFAIDVIYNITVE